MRMPADVPMKKTDLLLLASALAVMSLVGCKPAGSAPPVAAGAPPPVPVQTAVAQQADVPRIIESVGAVQALRTVAVK